MGKTEIRWLKIGPDYLGSKLNTSGSLFKLKLHVRTWKVDLGWEMAYECQMLQPSEPGFSPTDDSSNKRSLALSGLFVQLCRIGTLFHNQASHWIQFRLFGRAVFWINVKGKKITVVTSRNSRVSSRGCGVNLWCVCVGWESKASESSLIQIRGQSLRTISQCLCFLTDYNLSMAKNVVKKEW